MKKNYIIKKDNQVIGSTGEVELDQNYLDLQTQDGIEYVEITENEKIENLNCLKIENGKVVVCQERKAKLEKEKNKPSLEQMVHALILQDDTKLLEYKTYLEGL